MADVVTNWNLPLSHWLHTHMFQTGRCLGAFATVPDTYVASTLLHSLSFDLATVMLFLGFITYARHTLRHCWAAMFDACVQAWSGARAARAAMPEGAQGPQAVTIVQFSVSRVLTWCIYNWAGSNDHQVALLHPGYFAFLEMLDYNAAILGKKQVCRLFVVRELQAEGIRYTGISIGVRQLHRAWINPEVWQFCKAWINVRVVYRF